MKKILLLLLGLTIITGTTRANPVVIENVPFETSLQNEDLTLTLTGVALLRYRVVFRAYVGGFYVEQGTPPDRWTDDVGKRLELEYFWPIKAQDFVEASVPFLRDNVDPVMLRRIQDRLQTFNGFYQDVQPGDRYALSYAPGEGTSLLLNGKPLGSVPGADFARAYFSIWLGDRPLDKTFKQQVLGLR